MNRLIHVPQLTAAVAMMTATAHWPMAVKTSREYMHLHQKMPISSMPRMIESFLHGLIIRIISCASGFASFLCALCIRPPLSFYVISLLFFYSMELNFRIANRLQEWNTSEWKHTHTYLYKTRKGNDRVTAAQTEFRFLMFQVCWHFFFNHSFFCIHIHSLPRWFWFFFYWNFHTFHQRSGNSQQSSLNTVTFNLLTVS